ncbi:hypothetical protein GGX14DRAFT_576517 [Mycena pura]|uniref:Uncharacterized protein n=1 Tax=Mycena pura TaxID=153505 RepID=A0AAD6UXK1_9AGAR|nr:hypothetical protein GGX14DRAFT_576517 [Mycena pura]
MTQPLLHTHLFQVPYIPSLRRSLSESAVLLFVSPAVHFVHATASNLPPKRASMRAVLPPIHAFSLLQPLPDTKEGLCSCKATGNETTYSRRHSSKRLSRLYRHRTTVPKYVLQAPEHAYMHLWSPGASVSDWQHPDLSSIPCAGRGNILKMYGYTPDMITVPLDDGVPSHTQTTRPTSCFAAIWWGRAGGRPPRLPLCARVRCYLFNALTHDTLRCPHPRRRRRRRRGRRRRRTRMRANVYFRWTARRPIVDNELHKALVKPLPAGAHLVAVVAARCSVRLHLRHHRCNRVPVSWTWRGKRDSDEIHSQNVRRDARFIASSPCRLLTAADSFETSDASLTAALWVVLVSTRQDKCFDWHCLNIVGCAFFPNMATQAEGPGGADSLNTYGDDCICSRGRGQRERADRRSGTGRSGGEGLDADLVAASTDL